jgi:hypothetical protein
MDYNPATDILSVDYPDLENLLLPTIKHSLLALVEAIKSYDVKKLLLDASRTVVSVSEEENREVTIKLASELAKTRLEKVARVQPVDPMHETRAQANINRIKQAGLLPYQLQTFSTREEAIKWLLSGD